MIHLPTIKVDSQRLIIEYNIADAVFVCNVKNALINMLQSSSLDSVDQDTMYFYLECLKIFTLGDVQYEKALDKIE